MMLSLTTRRTSALAIALFIALSLGHAHATTIQRMSIERLTQASTNVVAGHALRSWSEWDPQHTLIYTYTEFQISSQMKGSATEVVRIKQMGGSTGGYTQKVAGVRHFLPGEEAVLFIHPSEAADGTMVITGLMQGNFRVSRSNSGEAMVENGSSQVDEFDPATHHTRAYSGSRLTLSQLKDRVKAAQQRQ